MKSVHIIAFILVIVGGINWLLHAFGWNIVDALLVEGSIWTKIVYVLVGLSAIYLAVTHKKACRDCVAGSSSSGSSAPMM